jgi:hypothetical protein
MLGGALRLQQAELSVWRLGHLAAVRGGQVLDRLGRWHIDCGPMHSPEDSMKKSRTVAALATLALTAIAGPASAQPSDTPSDYIFPPTPSQQPVSKSDEHRIVGKVLELDRDGGLVKLATEEGVVTVEVPARGARVFRIGDTVSVPRSSTESPSASPRE